MINSESISAQALVSNSPIFTISFFHFRHKCRRLHIGRSTGCLPGINFSQGAFNAPENQPLTANSAKGSLIGFRK
jgi:hypothetical protein